MEKTATELAREHWEWHKKFLKEVANIPDNDLDKFERIAIDYFLHGYKHGKENSAPIIGGICEFNSG